MFVTTFVASTVRIQCFFVVVVFLLGRHNFLEIRKENKTLGVSTRCERGLVSGPVSCVHRISFASHFAYIACTTSDTVQYVILFAFFVENLAIYVLFEIKIHSHNTMPKLSRNAHTSNGEVSKTGTTGSYYLT